ncbi:hypothetical protein CNMCM8980_007495 [Aspergillus fumigatiaffinis]|uniref:Xylanolytic transcriptional activator regulatory domain-containing protein n=1 Tax=Aspergillus fumigatiaffinis TaxID=340414 RepID=A0A8H4M965_9EURO|nr:hypothetical protein CNMCM5878_007341 [Aspergillus fumigatiaffinis]KAF4234817.1 hypothetical protein CNMCM6457_003768 [Aspergillus fumigatiaffinis]KAF4235956.1 hypothetical protein CNMCM6805_007744 [Aspergillus fumigatiaffinis]KAF4247316.1 hypothetical protein CNMCM8980_007495 [Aspergillus fumigatiaffinis]
MEASNDAREWEKERHEQQGLQFQNDFVGWDFRESPQSGPSMTRSAKSSTEHEYASKCPILVDHLDPLDVDILNQRHAFDLPSQAVCDALVDVFFRWIAPVLPVISRHDFMRRYRNPQDPPSILLLQAVLMVASRFHYNAQSSGNGVISPRIFYKKVKALYDAGYERDPTTVLQAVVLLGVYWDGPDDLTESGIFYWSRLGIALAQEHGLHQSENYVTLSATKRRVWKRIWWTLYTRDRSVAAAFGRPLHINSEDCTVEPLKESDFIEYDEQNDCSTDRAPALFFMQSTEDSRMKGAAQCELGLNDWLVSCPSELQWRQSRHSFWSAILYSTFYTIVCQLHLLQSPDSSKEAQSSAFHAATSIVSILETLQSKGELKYTPSFIICHAVVSFVTLRSQMEASVPSLLHAIRQNLEANLDMLQVLSHTWPIAAIFVELFRTMTGPEQFERKLSVAAENCRKRARGEENGDSTLLRSSARFKRPKTPTGRPALGGFGVEHSQPTEDVEGNDHFVATEIYKMTSNKPVALVVGASRGIGRQIAIDLAKNGYKVVVAAKTTSNAYATVPFPPDPNSSQSTINTVEREIKESGGEAFALPVDVRDVKQVENLVHEAVRVAGRLDVLVYNSGAIWWSSVANTPTKRFQLMQRVNPEGLYASVQAALPYFEKNGWKGRIIVVSPPIYSRFFRGKTAYAMGKVGMSVLTKGLAMDFVRQGAKDMAITSIWPAVSIESAATEATTNEDPSRKADLRKATIFSDAILGILNSPTDIVNGQLVLDEDFLRDHCGVSDFSKYAVVPGSQPRRIMPKELPVLEVTEQDDEGMRVDSTKLRKAKL